MNIKEGLDLRGFTFGKDFDAVGKVCIDLIDPITSKVKHRVDGKNQVFVDSVVHSGSWPTKVSSALMVLNDSDYPTDANLPFVAGVTLGYGKPSTAGTGLYRGAYNAANQILANVTPEKIAWKFQYDFLTTQANGIIKNAGLTNQYLDSSFGGFTWRQPLTRYKTTGNITGTNLGTNDGRYMYSITAAGVITKTDLWSNTSTTIDKSAVVGNTAGEYKMVGVNPVTRRYYVMVYSGTAANRRMYEFSDNTFGTLLNTYSPTNNTLGNSSVAIPVYVYGGVAYYYANGAISKVDFVNNTAPVAVPYSTTHNVIPATEGQSTNTNTYFADSTMAYDKYVIHSGGSSDPYAVCNILDITTGTVVAQQEVKAGFSVLPRYSPSALYPYTINKLPCLMANGDFYTNAALTSFVLPEAVEKTSSYALKATYELELYWG